MPSFFHKSEVATPTMAPPISTLAAVLVLALAWYVCLYVSRARVYLAYSHWAGKPVPVPVRKELVRWNIQNKSCMLCCFLDSHARRSSSGSSAQEDLAALDPSSSAQADLEAFDVSADDLAAVAMKSTPPYFPFFECSQEPASYSLAPVIKNMGGGQYCFTLLTTLCDHPCCNVDLKKIEVRL